MASLNLELQFSILGTEGVGFNNASNITDVNSQTTAELQQQETFDSGTGWNFNGVWVWTEDYTINYRYPALLYVGISQISVTATEGGFSTSIGTDYALSNKTQYFQITADEGYVINKIYVNKSNGLGMEIFTNMQGEEQINFAVNTDADDVQIHVEFMKKAFYESMLFLILSVFGLLILIVIIAFMIINGNYEKQTQSLQPETNQVVAEIKQENKRTKEVTKPKTITAKKTTTTAKKTTAKKPAAKKATSTKSAATKKATITKKPAVKK